MMQYGVVGLRRSGSPDQVERVAPEKVREPLPGAGDGCVRSAADAMGTGGVANEVLDGIQPGLPRYWQHCCCGVVVEVDHSAGGNSPFGFAFASDYFHRQFLAVLHGG